MNIAGKWCAQKLLIQPCLKFVNKDMVERIRINLGLTSLKYQKLNDLVEAIGLPKEKLCTHCWDESSYF